MRHRPALFQLYEVATGQGNRAALRSLPTTISCELVKLCHVSRTRRIGPVFLRHSVDGERGGLVLRSRDSQLVFACIIVATAT